MAGKEGGNLSSDKLFRIIECLAANRLPNRLTDLADKLDMPQPTLLRYLKTLCAQGYAYHDDVTGCYALTWKICRLADSVKSNLSLRSIASPFLNHFSNAKCRLMPGASNRPVKAKIVVSVKKLVLSFLTLPLTIRV